MKVGILGGGLSGLALARLLGDCDVEVLEAEEEPGGLCRSFEWEGHRGDYGGHILFSKDQEALRFCVESLGDNVDLVRRENRILYKNALVKYPFENDLAGIPPQDRYECLYHFLFDSYPSPRNLEEWCYFTFGRGISEAYLLPYNRKIWKYEPRELSVAWVDRIPKPPKEDIIKSALGIATEGYTHQLYFHYPRKGGIQALITALATTARVHTGFRVSAVEKEADGWIVTNDRGNQRKYDRIISTIPIFHLFEALRFADREIAQRVKELQYNSLICAMVCLSTPCKRKITAMYVPDRAVVFHRLCSMDCFSPENSPPSCSTLLAEITVRPGLPESSLSDLDVAERVTTDLERLGLVERKEIAHIMVTRQKYGYVLNDLDYEARLQEIHAWLQKKDLPVCGRFAEFRYYNMDACVRSAFRIAEEVWKG